MWIKEKNYICLVKFVMEAIIDLLRDKMKDSFGKKTSDLRGLEDVVFLEQCVLNGMISYPEFISIGQILNTIDKSTFYKT